MAESTPNPPAEQPLSEATRQKLADQRVAFGNTIKNYFPVLFGLTVLITLALILLPALGFSSERTMDATVLAASIQVAFGMLLGFVCVYIGLMMTWIGVEAAYSVKGTSGPSSVVLTSASPGLLFALGGIVLVTVSLNKQIVYEESTGRHVDTKAIDPKVKRSEIAPESPKTMFVMPAGASPSATGPATRSDNGAPATFSDQVQSEAPPPGKQSEEK